MARCRQYRDQRIGCARYAARSCGAPVRQPPEPVEGPSDNGSVCPVRGTRIFAQQPGLKSCFTPVKSRQANGMSEAFVKTLERDYVRVNPLPNAQTGLSLIGDWIEDYNENHPHSGLKWKSPREFIRAKTETASVPAETGASSITSFSKEDNLMSKVSYFQRFSQKENHATNNTLLVMRHFYQASPQNIEAVLSDLAGDHFSVGLVFEQQIKLPNSVPDALISQSPMDVFFETKRGGDLDQKQIEQHILSISQSVTHTSRKILFGLTKTPIDRGIKKQLESRAKSHKIIFIAITFADIVDSLQSVCEREPHETALRDILADYEEYLTEEGLLQIGDVMSVVPCGASMTENVKHRLYCECSTRPSKSQSKFMGLYSQKCIKHLADIHTVVSGVMQDGKFVVSKTEKGQLSDQQQKRIEDAIADGTYFGGFALHGYRYYLFNEIHETDIRKITKGGIWGARVFNLSEWLDYNKPTKEYSVKEAAERLKGKEFS